MPNGEKEHIIPICWWRECWQGGWTLQPLFNGDKARIKLGKEFSLLAMKWMWSREGKISKILGTSFGLHLGVQDVDSLWTKLKGNSSFGAFSIC